MEMHRNLKSTRRYTENVLQNRKKKITQCGREHSDSLVTIVPVLIL